jgi:hypothetical protein
VRPSTQGKSAPTRWAGGCSKETAVQASAGHDGSDNAEGDLPGDPASVGKRASTIRPAIRSFRSFAGEKARGGLGSGLPFLRTDRSGMRPGWGLGRSIARAQPSNLASAVSHGGLLGKPAGSSVCGLCGYSLHVRGGPPLDMPGTGTQRRPH